MVVFDKGGMTEEEVEDANKSGKEGDENVTKDEEVEENKEAGESGKDGESGADGGADHSEDGEESGTEEGEDGEEKGGVGDLGSFKEQLLTDVKDIFKEHIKPKEAEKETPKKVTEEEKIALEAEYGIPYAAIERNEKKMGIMYEKIMDAVNDKVSGFQKGEALKTLSKTPGYQDAQKYGKEVDSFLSKFDKKHHSDPEMLKMAIDAARGKNMKSEVIKAHNNGERNRKIGGAFRPAGSGGKKGVASKPLTDMEKQAADRSHMSHTEYRQLKSKGKAVFA